MSAEGYLHELGLERDSLDPSRYGHALRLLGEEMFRVGGNEERPGNFPRGDEIPGGYQPEVYPPYREEIVKLEEKVMLPVKEFPKFNFVGRLLGPKGSIMKSIAESTKTKIKILGRGSMKDKAKEEELSKSEDTKHEHLKESLHVLVLVEGPKSECHARLANALEEIKNVLSYQDDEQMHEQMGEMGPMPGFSKDPEMHMGRGSHPEARYGGPPEGRIHDDLPPAGRGRAPRGGGRGQRPAPVPRNSAPRDSYPYDAPGPRYEKRYEETGGAPQYDYPADRGSFRQGEKRIISSNGYPTKKFREDTFDDGAYPPREGDAYYYNAARY